MTEPANRTAHDAVAALYADTFRDILDELPRRNPLPGRHGRVEEAGAMGQDGGLDAVGEGQFRQAQEPPRHLGRQHLKHWWVLLKFAM